jgi:hypothetical protein
MLGLISYTVCFQEKKIMDRREREQKRLIR